MHHITLLPEQVHISAAHGTTVLEVLRNAGYAVDAPCGGTGKCGKCLVNVDGVTVHACKTIVDRDMLVTLSHTAVDVSKKPLLRSISVFEGTEWRLAFDIGTTTVVGYLLCGGRVVCTDSRLNPQVCYGADVISRIRAALDGNLSQLTSCIRNCVNEIILHLCGQAQIPPTQISHISVAGNPAMEQLFLGISPENLARVPFSPILKKAVILPAAPYLSICPNSEILVVPNISGFVGGDTVACMLSTGIAGTEHPCLLVDIGTNGELVMGNRDRLVACSTAAGPALEGASISCGMRGQDGAIDHVWVENGKLRYHVMGGGEAKGICGSGLIDAVAAGLELGLLNKRGRILNASRVISLTATIFLTQDDIRQVQTAKGAIAAGIRLMASHLGISLRDISQVFLTGAFGSYMRPESACRIGLLPQELADKITAVGNAAGQGAVLLALDPKAENTANTLAEKPNFLELASLPEFPRCFAKSMEL